MYQQPMTYHPSMRRGGFQPIVAPVYTSKYMAQGTTPPPQGQTTAPPPALTPPPPAKPSTALVLGVGAGGGALLGFLVTFLMGKADRRFPRGPGVNMTGAVGGLVGGLAGAGLTLLLKD